MTKVINQITYENEDNPKMTPIHYGECPKCFAIVSRSQYGRDEECPNCGSFLNWFEELRNDLK